MTEMKQSFIILNHNVRSISLTLYNVTFQSLSNDRMQSIHFMSENKTIVSLKPQ